MYGGRYVTSVAVAGIPIGKKNHQSPSRRRRRLAVTNGFPHPLYIPRPQHRTSAADCVITNINAGSDLVQSLTSANIEHRVRGAFSLVFFCLLIYLFCLYYFFSVLRTAVTAWGVLVYCTASLLHYTARVAAAVFYIRYNDVCVIIMISHYR